MSMATSALANSKTFLLSSSSSSLIHKTIFPFSLTKTSPFLISFTTPSRRFLSVSSSLRSLSPNHDFNFSDSGGDGNGVAVSTRGSKSKVLLKGMTYSELEVCFLFIIYDYILINFRGLFGLAYLSLSTFISFVRHFGRIYLNNLSCFRLISYQHSLYENKF